MASNTRTMHSWYLKRFPIVSALPAFSPADISGLTLWYDASDASSITLDGSNNVTQWNDKSGGGRHMVQATVNLRPSYGTQTQNGLPLVVTDFNGPTRLETAANIPTTTMWGASRTGGTLFRVVRSISGTINGGIHQEFGIFNNTLIFRPTQVLNFRIGGVNNDANGNYGLTLPTGNMDILSHIVDTTVPAVYVRRNRSLVSTLTPANTTPFSSGVNQYYAINWSGSGTTAYHAEHVFYNRVLTAGEIDQVEAYLRTKWGTA